MTNNDGIRQDEYVKTRYVQVILSKKTYDVVAIPWVGYNEKPDLLGKAQYSFHSNADEYFVNSYSRNIDKARVELLKSVKRQLDEDVEDARKVYETLKAKQESVERMIHENPYVDGEGRMPTVIRCKVRYDDAADRFVVWEYRVPKGMNLPEMEVEERFGDMFGDCVKGRLDECKRRIVEGMIGIYKSNILSAQKLIDERVKESSKTCVKNEGRIARMQKVLEGING